MLLLQFVWLLCTLDGRMAGVNLLPAGLLIIVWALFVSEYLRPQSLRQYCLFLMPVFLLTLRLPVSLHAHFIWLNWGLSTAMLGLLAAQILKVFPRGLPRLLLLLAAASILFNTGTHIGANSPYTYTERLLRGLAPSYQGVDNNLTWECPLDTPQNVVHCDMRHFIAPERLFTEPGFDPSYSVVLQRFLHGYLVSLVSISGIRFWMNVLTNAVFWLLAVVALYRSGKLLGFTDEVAGCAMLCCASGIGFVDMVSQPLPYALAYAYGVIAIWAVVALIYGNLNRTRAALMVLIIAMLLLIYDAFQLVAALAFVLYMHRRRWSAAGIVIGGLLLTTMWRLFSLQMVLGTQGNLESYATTKVLIGLDFTVWREVLSTFDIATVSHLGATGFVAYLYGNLFIGALAMWAYIVGFGAQHRLSDGERTLYMTLLAVHVMVIASMIFLVPQMMMVSRRTAMQPRFAFYGYPISMIALTCLLWRYYRPFIWVVPIFLFFLVNLNLFGFAGVDLLFNNGSWGWYWK